MSSPMDTTIPKPTTSLPMAELTPHPKALKTTIKEHPEHKEVPPSFTSLHADPIRLALFAG